jgi:uncharacterized protein (DUF58 family)
MIVPQTRLMAWVAVFVPVAVAGATLPGVAGPAAAAFALLGIAAAADAWLGGQRVRGVRVSLPAVVRMAVDRPASIPVTVSLASGRALTVRLGLPLPPGVTSDDETLDVALPAGPGASVVWPCRSAVRGSLAIRGCYVELPSPLGFWGVRAVAACSTELRVYPNLLGERKRLASVFMRRGQVGIHARRLVGHGREFEKLREYAPGDTYEDIHWKATARRGRPITKLFQVERTREIYVAVDTSRLSARDTGGEPALEHFLSAALVLGLAAQQQGDLFGLITFNRRVNRFIRAGRGHAHDMVCRDALYALQSDPGTPDFQELATFVRTRLRKRALVLVLTDLSDPVLAEAFQRGADLVCRHHLLMAFMVRPPGVGPLFAASDADSTERVYQNLAGHLMWTDLREVGRRLQHKGVGFIMSPRGTLSADLVSRYMSVKARQML